MSFVLSISTNYLENLFRFHISFDLRDLHPRPAARRHHDTPALGNRAPGGTRQPRRQIRPILRGPRRQNQTRTGFTHLSHHAPVHTRHLIDSAAHQNTAIRVPARPQMLLNHGPERMIASHNLEIVNNNERVLRLILQKSLELIRLGLQTQPSQNPVSPPPEQPTTNAVATPAPIPRQSV